ncbi:MAG: hypothetical protein K0S75_938 [Clostridia bacterium]|jgi:hypothetical protein|nr:hypothetical protein [Clostridia bacterium]
MKKTAVYIFAGIICLSIGLGWYLSPMPLNSLVEEQMQIEDVEEIGIDILTVYLHENYKVKDKEDIDKIINAFEILKVRRVISPPVTFRPPSGKTYYFTLISENKAVPIVIMDKDYLTVMRQTYKIVKSPDLKQIDDIIDSLK